MNLKELREQIKNITDYSPELQAYSNQLDQLLNFSYFNLWRSKRWSFAQKQTFLEAYPDINSDRELGPAGGVDMKLMVENILLFRFFLLPHLQLQNQ